MNLSWKDISGIVLVIVGFMWFFSSFVTASTARFNLLLWKYSPDTLIGYPIPVETKNWRMIAGIVAVIIGLIMIEHTHNYTGVLPKVTGMIPNPF